MEKTDERARCYSCKRPLADDEIEYYGNTCEQCERRDHEVIRRDFERSVIADLDAASPSDRSPVTEGHTPPWRVAFAHWGKAGIQRDVAEGEVWDNNLSVNGVPTVSIAPIELDPKIARAIVEAHNSTRPPASVGVTHTSVTEGHTPEPFAWWVDADDGSYATRDSYHAEILKHRRVPVRPLYIHPPANAHKETEGLRDALQQIRQADVGVDTQYSLNRAYAEVQKIARLALNSNGEGGK